MWSGYLGVAIVWGLPHNLVSFGRVLGSMNALYINQGESLFRESVSGSSTATDIISSLDKLLPSSYFFWNLFCSMHSCRYIFMYKFFQCYSDASTKATSLLTYIHIWLKESSATDFRNCSPTIFLVTSFCSVLGFQLPVVSICTLTLNAKNYKLKTSIFLIYNKIDTSLCYLTFCHLILFP